MNKLLILGIGICLLMIIPLSNAQFINYDYGKDTLVTAPDTNILKSISKRINSVIRSLKNINEDLPFPLIPITDMVHEFIDNPLYYFKHGCSFFISLTVIMFVLSLIVPVIVIIIFLIGYPLVG